MGNTGFVSADIEKLVDFETKSQEAITEFDAIKTKFNDINTTLIGNWKGEGKSAYKKESDHILENIGGIKDILDSINEGVIKDTKDAYLNLDEELGTFNRNPSSGEGE